MMKILDRHKQYRVSGEVLQLISDLSYLYTDVPVWCEQQVISFPSEKRDYLIGRLVQEFSHCDWEEI